MRVLLLLMVVAGAACRRTASEDPAQLYQTALSDLRQGRLQQAESRLSTYFQRSPPPSTVPAYRLQLLDAEVLLAQGRTDEVIRRIAQPLPPTPPFEELRLQQQLVRAQALSRQDQFDQADALLAQIGPEAHKKHFKELALKTAVARGSNLAGAGKIDAAERALEQALSTAIEQGDQYQQSAILLNLSFCKLKRFRFDETVDYAQRSLDAAQKAQAGRVVAYALGNLALGYSQLGDFIRAGQFRQKALDLQKNMRDRVAMQESYGEMGNLHALQHQYQQAVPFYEQAYQLALEQKSDGEAAKWAGNLSLAHAETKQWERARHWDQVAWTLDEKLGDREGLIYLMLNRALVASGTGSRDEAVRLLKQVIEQSPHNPGLRWDAYAELGRLHAQAREWPAANRNFQLALSTIEEARTELLNRESKITFLARLISFYQADVDALVAQGRPWEALQVADSSRARILKERLNSEPGPAHPPLTLSQLKAQAARTRTAFVFYWLAPSQSFVWAVGPRTEVFQVLPPENEIASLVNTYRKQVEVAIADTVQSEQALVRRVYEVLLKPLEAVVPRDGRVLLVTDGSLHRLNFETIVVPGTRPHYWLEDVTLQVAPSLSLVLERGKAAGPTALRSFLLIGDPQPVSPQWPKLPKAAQEIANIESHFTPAARTVRVGAEATPQCYLDSRPGSFSVIHFASHAEVNRERPLESAVILSRTPQGYKLYARDVLDHPLQARLVTISACRGVGETTYAGEGTLGFSWAFLQAGARSVVAGLWDVSDSSTAQLMDRFYAELAAGHEPAESLRTAKLSLLQSRGPFRKPYYWGPFQTYGRSL